MKMRVSKQMGQQGMVSILVTMIMMIVISLIILAITQATRSNQRSQLDNQLSAQAYYAAESGLNQAVKFFASHVDASLNTNGNCTQFMTNAAPNGLGIVPGTGNVLDANTKISYTCLMVNSTPALLRKAPLTQEGNAIWRVHDAAGNPFTKLEFKWRSNSSATVGASPCTIVGSFPKYSNWNCAYGILRVDLMNTQGNQTQNELESTVTKTLYLVPTVTASGVGAKSLDGTKKAEVIYVSCAGGTCGIVLTPSLASNEYYVRLSMLYQDADSVQLGGTDAGGTARFSGGQAVIDATGKAGDQLRRVQARIPLTAAGMPMPNFALQTTEELCKQMLVTPGADASDSCL